MLLKAAKTLEDGGADFILLCTNTMHKLYEQIEKGLNIPLLHIADATAERIQEASIKKVGLLGTRQTMEQEFYKSRIEDKGIQVMVPNETDRELVHDVIFNELCLGIMKEESRKNYIRIIDKLISIGAEGVILGCTEIPLLLKNNDLGVQLFDTTSIHAMKAVERAINGASQN